MTDAALVEEDALDSEPNAVSSSVRDFAVDFAVDDSHLKHVLESFKERYARSDEDATPHSGAHLLMADEGIRPNGIDHS